MTVAVHDPAAAAALWGVLLGVEAEGVALTLDEGRQRIAFVETAGPERITAVDVVVATGQGDVEIAGVTFRRMEEKDTR
jgi:hypothetical protein